jgi:hypothetical protein
MLLGRKEVIRRSVTRRSPMKEPRTQLGLALPVRHPAEVPAEVEQQIVTALADLLMAVAMHDEAAREGEGDEREDP